MRFQTVSNFRVVRGPPVRIRLRSLCRGPLATRVRAQAVPFDLQFILRPARRGTAPLSIDPAAPLNRSPPAARRTPAPATAPTPHGRRATLTPAARPRAPWSREVPGRRAGSGGGRSRWAGGLVDRGDVIPCPSRRLQRQGRRGTTPARDAPAAAARRRRKCSPRRLRLAPRLRRRRCSPRKGSATLGGFGPRSAMPSRRWPRYTRRSASNTCRAQSAWRCVNRIGCGEAMIGLW